MGQSEPFFLSLYVQKIWIEGYIICFPFFLIFRGVFWILCFGLFLQQRSGFWCKALAILRFLFWDFLPSFCLPFSFFLFFCLIFYCFCCVLLLFLIEGMMILACTKGDYLIWMKTHWYKSWRSDLGFRVWRFSVLPYERQFSTIYWVVQQIMAGLLPARQPFAATLQASGDEESWNNKKLLLAPGVSVYLFITYLSFLRCTEKNSLFWYLDWSFWSVSFWAFWERILSIVWAV